MLITVLFILVFFFRFLFYSSHIEVLFWLNYFTSSIIVLMMIMIFVHCYTQWILHSHIQTFYMYNYKTIDQIVNIYTLFRHKLFRYVYLNHSKWMCFSSLKYYLSKHSLTITVINIVFHWGQHFNIYLVYKNHIGAADMNDLILRKKYFVWIFRFTDWTIKYKKMPIPYD